MKDRRQHTRINVSLSARLYLESGKTLAARVKDLSLGGCYLQSLARVELGESVRCVLQLSEEEILELSGTVAFHRPYIGLGLEFGPLTQEKTEQLKEIIAKIEKTE